MNSISTLKVSFNNSSAGDNYWIVLESVEEPNTVGKDKIADVMDTLYDINPCEGVIVEPDQEQTDELPFTEEDFNDAIKEVFDLNLCNGLFDGSYVIKIKVIKSHPTEQYRLRVTNGSVGQTVHVDKPYVKSEGVTVYGYDLVDIYVNGIDGKPGVTTVLAFYHGLVEELDISPPEGVEADYADIQKYCGDPIINVIIPDSNDVVTCYESVTYQYKCECGGQLSYEIIEEVEVPCPESLTKCSYGAKKVDDHYECRQKLGTRIVVGGYVACPGDEGLLLNSATHYKDLCCHEPNSPLPACHTKYSKNPGGKSPDTAAMAYYWAVWGDRVEFIGVSPKDNDCGVIKTVITVSAQNCCNEVDPLEINEESSVSILSDNSAGIVYLARPSDRPFSVSVRGDGFYADGNHTSRDVTYSYGNTFLVYTADACGTCTIIVSDGCSSVTHYIKSTRGRWINILADYDNLPNGCFGGFTSAVKSGSSILVTAECGAYEVVEQQGVSPDYDYGILPGLEDYYYAITVPKYVYCTAGTHTFWNGETHAEWVPIMYASTMPGIPVDLDIFPKLQNMTLIHMDWLQVPGSRELYDAGGKLVGLENNQPKTSIVCSNGLHDYGIGHYYYAPYGTLISIKKWVC